MCSPILRPLALTAAIVSAAAAASAGEPLLLRYGARPPYGPKRSRRQRPARRHGVRRRRGASACSSTRRPCGRADPTRLEQPGRARSPARGARRDLRRRLRRRPPTLAKQMQGPYTSRTSRSATCASSSAARAAVPGCVRAQPRSRPRRSRASATAWARPRSRARSFSSFPDQVDRACASPATSRAASTFTARGATARCATPSETDGRDTLVLRGRAPAHVDPSYLQRRQHPIRYDDGAGPEGMTFELRVRGARRGRHASPAAARRLRVAKADAVTLLDLAPARASTVPTSLPAARAATRRPRPRARWRPRRSVRTTICVARHVGRPSASVPARRARSRLQPRRAA